MGKYRVGRGFTIASVVVSAIGLFFVLIGLLVITGTTSVIKELVIDAGGSAVINGNPFVLVIENIESISETSLDLEASGFEVLDVASLELIYLLMYFAQGAMIFSTVICALALAMSIVILVLVNKANSKAKLTAPMVLSFINTLFVGFLGLVPGILFACVNDKDFEVID